MPELCHPPLPPITPPQVFAGRSHVHQLFRLHCKLLRRHIGAGPEDVPTPLCVSQRPAVSVRACTSLVCALRTLTPSCAAALQLQLRAGRSKYGSDGSRCPLLLQHQHVVQGAVHLRHVRSALSPACWRLCIGCSVASCSRQPLTHLPFPMPLPIMPSCAAAPKTAPSVTATQPALPAAAARWRRTPPASGTAGKMAAGGGQAVHWAGKGAGQRSGAGLGPAAQLPPTPPRCSRSCAADNAAMGAADPGTCCNTATQYGDQGFICGT